MCNTQPPASTALILMCRESSTEISPELMSKLEKKARHKGVSAESLIETAIDSFVSDMIRGSYPSGDNG